MNHRVRRRDFLRSGIVGLAGGSIATSSRTALARNLANLHQWLRIARIDRTTVKLPYGVVA